MFLIVDGWEDANSKWEIDRRANKSGRSFRNECGGGHWKWAT